MNIGTETSQALQSRAGVWTTILIFWNVCLFNCFWCNSLQWAMTSSFTRFLDHTQRRITVGMTPLDERSAHRRDLYLTTHTKHSRQTAMPPVVFEPIISAGERPQTYVLDRAATGTGFQCLYVQYISGCIWVPIFTVRLSSPNESKSHGCDLAIEIMKLNRND